MKYPRCAACNIKLRVGTTDIECPRCGEKAIVHNDHEARKYNEHMQRESRSV